MPFIPHTATELQAMLDVIGIAAIEDLFQEIPPQLRCGTLNNIPAAINEAQIAGLMRQRAREDGQPLCFLGAGAYQHHIPAAVWQIATRGEYYSAYTPYQAESSQGTLQLLYEYQSMITSLAAMEVSNASLYDGASALAEALLMAVRANKSSKSKRILIPRALHPTYRKVAQAIVHNQGLELVEIPFDMVNGNTSIGALEPYVGQDITALVIPQPNFFGILEDVAALTNWAHSNKALAIAVVNPLALAILQPPGNWGNKGADICCGEGQPLGIPLSSGGPYFGFMCTKKDYLRQMPGRIVGATKDRNGKIGYTLTLQAREQHIRRSKATSNICTNQGLMVTAATIHMALLGSTGLAQVATACHNNTNELSQQLTTIDGVTKLFKRSIFHEQVLQLPISAQNCLKALSAHGILGGYALAPDYPELGNSMLVCATELRTDQEISLYRDTLARIITSQNLGSCHIPPIIN